MLELYFKYPRVLRRLRSGAFGEEMDRIAAHFFEVGYKRASAKIYISQIARFSVFAVRHAGAATIDQDMIDRFVQSSADGHAADRSADSDRTCSSAGARPVFDIVSPNAGSP